MHVFSQESERSCSSGFWNCSNSVVFVCLVFFSITDIPSTLLRLFLFSLPMVIGYEW